MYTIAFLLLSAGAQGRTIEEQPLQTFVLKSHESVRARILGLDAEKVRLRIAAYGGWVDVDHRLEDFTPHSAYVMKASLLPDASPDAHLELASFAARNGLIAVAERELAKARAGANNRDVGAEVAREIQRKAVESIAKMAREALARGDVAAGRRYTSELLLRYPDGTTAEEKERWLDEVRNAEENAIERRRAREANLEAERARKEIEKLVKPVRTHLDQGRAANRQALLTLKSFNTAHGLFRKAAEHFRSASRDATDAFKAHAKETALGDSMAPLVEQAESGLTTALLNAGSLCTVQGDFREAIGHVNEILAHDPTNKEARDLRARIEVAANSPLWGYGRRFLR